MKNLIDFSVPDDAPVCDLFMDGVGKGCVTAADEAGLFTALRDEGRSSTAVAMALQKDPRAIDAVFRVLVTMGFLSFRDGTYSLSDLTRAYFLNGSRTYRGYQFYSNRESWEHKRVAKLIASGWDPISQNDQSFTEMWEKGTLTQEAADRFTGMMHTNISGPAIAIARSGIFAKFSRVMDAGGGSGIFLAALKQAYPNIDVALLELPQVCESAKKLLKNYVETDAVRFVPCNFLKEPWPGSPDAIFMSNILHDWPYEKGQQILSNAYSTLASGGSIFINECLLNEGRLGPKHTVIFDLLMYMNHRAQQYTVSELNSALLSAGFRNPTPVFSFGYYTVVRAEK